jgi:hypothetical protein
LREKPQASPRSQADFEAPARAFRNVFKKPAASRINSLQDTRLRVQNRAANGLCFGFGLEWLFIQSAQTGKLIYKHSNRDGERRQEKKIKVKKFV